MYEGHGVLAVLETQGKPSDFLSLMKVQARGAEVDAGLLLLPLSALVYFWRQGLSLNLGLTIFSRLVDRDPGVILSPLPQS